MPTVTKTDKFDPSYVCNNCKMELVPSRSGWVCPTGCPWEAAGRRWKDHPDPATLPK